MKRDFFKKVALGLGLALSLNMGTPVMARGNKLFGEYAQGEILSFGSSLNKAQEANLREYFKAPDDIKAIYVTTEMAVEQLGLDKSAINTYKGGWYSSAYVKLTDGTGINVKANNLTLVTDDMLANALITSGILNADVIASSPFNVTGESALAGILAGAEEIMGEKLSQDNKETAQKEIETTLDVADEIGKKEASTIMNEIKAEVIKDSPINNTQIENIVINITNNYGVELSDKARARVVDTMSDINDLDINYKDVKDTLKDVGNKLFDDLKSTLDKGEEVGMQIKESGVFQKIIDWGKNLWTSFLDFVKGNKAENENSKPTDEEKNSGSTETNTEGEQSPPLGDTNEPESPNEDKNVSGDNPVEDFTEDESTEDKNEDVAPDVSDDNNANADGNNNEVTGDEATNDGVDTTVDNENVSSN